MKIPGIFFHLFAAGLFALTALRAVLADDWSEQERQLELEQQALEVNEGELLLLDKPPQLASHHHQNRLLITEQSLNDGWVAMYQCHSDLDKVSASQIVYRKDRIRNIKILSAENIGSAIVEGHTIQIRNIAAESEICISADKRALFYDSGRYYLRLGPFMRRFLDGYYPMRVQLEVGFPSFLRLVSSSPVKARQRFRNKNTYADIDIWVVGKLDVELVFVDKLSGN